MKPEDYKALQTLTNEMRDVVQALDNKLRAHYNLTKKIVEHMSSLEGRITELENSAPHTFGEIQHLKNSHELLDKNLQYLDAKMTKKLDNVIQPVPLQPHMKEAEEITNHVLSDVDNHDENIPRKLIVAKKSQRHVRTSTPFVAEQKKMPKNIGRLSIYTKQQLDKLSWNTLKREAKKRGHPKTNIMSRAKLTDFILGFQKTLIESQEE